LVTARARAERALELRGAMDTHRIELSGVEHRLARTPAERLECGSVVIAKLAHVARRHERSCIVAH